MASRHATAKGATTKTSRKRGAPEDDAKPPAKRVKATASKASKMPPTKARRGRPPAAPTPSSQPVQHAVPTTRLEVFVFGEGSAGELGLGTKNATNVTTPRLNPNLDAKSVGVVALASGGMHAAAITHDNKLLTWGVNDNGALGRDTAWEGGMRDVDAADDSDSDASDSDLNPRESTPTAIPADKFPAGTKFVQLAASDSATWVLTEEGLVYGWGAFRDSKGDKAFSLKSDQASFLKSDEKIIKEQREPALVANLKNITQLSAGSDYCLALNAEGTVFAWGYAEQYQLGRRLVQRRILERLIPTRVALPKKKIVSIHAQADHAFAIDTNGDTWAWGSNNFGQTGITDGAGEGSSGIIGPRKVASLAGRKMKMIQGGLQHSIGLTQSGDCLVWGRMDGSQMGLDLTTLPLDDPKTILLDDRGKPRVLLRPTRVPIPPCVHVAAASDHNVAITSDGKAYSWGFNATYQCGFPAPDEIAVAKLINGAAVRGKELCWAGAGGQYSMLASPYRGS